MFSAAKILADPLWPFDTSMLVRLQFFGHQLTHELPFDLLGDILISMLQDGAPFCCGVQSGRRIRLLVQPILIIFVCSLAAAIALGFAQAVAP